MKNLMKKVYKTKVFEVILHKSMEKIGPFSTCPVLRLDFHLQNGSNTFVKTVCAITEYNNIAPNLF